MATKPSTKRSFYLVDMALMVAIGLHFLLLNDTFFTILLFFTGLLNLIAYLQLPEKVSDRSIFINFFNGFLLMITSYNYSEQNMKAWLIICAILCAAYFFASARQYFLRARYRRFKKNKLKRFK